MILVLKPNEGAERAYARLNIGKVTGEGKVLKLALNSLYGKLAQTGAGTRNERRIGDLRMTLVNIKLLQRWRVDREAGQTANGPEQLVILVLKPNEGAERAYAMSKVDAMAIAIQMQLAAQDAQAS